MGTDFKRKVIVITGATGGIGRSLALRFAAARARVVLLDLDPLQLSSLKNQIEKLGAEALDIQCDVSDQAQCVSAIKRTISHYGNIDVLINNAGITHRSRFIDTSLKVFHKVMDVNFYGALYCTQAALPDLVKHRGMIITLSSIAGFTPQLERSAYAASKHALHGLFESLRAEVKDQGVHVMMVCPGFTATDLNKNALTGDGDVTNQSTAFVGKVAAPADVADTIYKSAARGRKLVILSNISKVSRFLSLFFPKAFQRAMVDKITPRAHKH